MTPALVMAGGEGTRMSGSGIAVPKPLWPVAGVPLLEHNVRRLLAAGCDHVHIAVAEHDRPVRAFITEVLTPLCRDHGVGLTEVTERVPLGNIGAAALVPTPSDGLLVVYADNLTTVDLPAIVADHAATGADLTLAAHREPFTMPFGELVVADDDPTRVTTYREKPTPSFLVSSAVIVIAPSAVRLLPAGQAIGISELANRVLASGGAVRAWHHDALWVDVNDATAAARAEGVVRDHAEAFGLGSAQRDTGG